MKLIFFTFLIFLSCFGAIAQNSNVKDNLDPLWEIEQKIETAVAKMQRNGNSVDLDSISHSLGSFRKHSLNYAFNYWQAYAIYKKAEFLKDDQNNDSKVEKHLEKGIDILEKIPYKHADDYILMAAFRVLKLQYEDIYLIPFSYDAIESSLQRAFELDDQNVRYFLVKAQYQESKIQLFSDKNLLVEKSLLQAIELSHKSSPRVNNRPTWGTEQAYMSLVELYKEIGEVVQAKQYLNEANHFFSKNYMVKKLDLELNLNNNPYFRH
ncbi:hypothetical protein [Aureibacter tunicatorum]|uniref:Tetratricopeptide (TPR) repeat protein n=1 Tax=Aureibacter tunicatorum TaxID=866807 RepID=A0AAE3XS98_9BACT|nr:hypothetical protein [Aureibacter tunicatorum]MDR6241833.1 tetratricopeptide (TPR) repeat protein [Aureibacter tunicatorum]BDD07080.1 hypothetical protein AUTU_45630 [Aureibacter tunicatorum]